MREEEMTVGHLFRASFQNMADNFLASAKRLSPEQAWQRLVFSGGLVQRLPILRTLICDTFGVEHRLSPTVRGYDAWPPVIGYGLHRSCQFHRRGRSRTTPFLLGARWTLG